MLLVPRSRGIAEQGMTLALACVRIGVPCVCGYRVTVYTVTDSIVLPKAINYAKTRRQGVWVHPICSAFWEMGRDGFKRNNLYY